MTDGRLRSLEHPLPAGMRDLLPEDAAARRALAHTVLERLELHGYRLVTPPAFELAAVVERGLGTGAAADVLRFIEPESGDVAVLRPDMTPQIARIVATRLRDHAPPYRLAYEGTVIRRRAGRAKKHRQIPQIGVELCGVADASADLELLELAASSLRAAGVERFTIDVGDAGIVRALLEGATEDDAERITGALARKDEARLADVTRALPSAATRAALLALPRLHGGRDALVDASKVLAATPAASAAERLLALFDRAQARGLGGQLTSDAGEVRGFAYYTGTMFSIYAPGPGAPIGAGGRYDELLSRFGAPMPAIGFGLDLDALAWARRSAGASGVAPSGVVVVGPPDDARLERLRGSAIAAVSVEGRDAALAYARSWRFRWVWDGADLLDMRTGTACPDVKATPDGVSGMLERLTRGD
ncbi:MAG: ATP phosphoribosyltransferase regulatory subunit [Deltaproteobacteria bacterium]|nr:ATP phosphoribosyltransferase regulatory subunit [Deltaproteobacteria bacterium]